jgi:hypothetical protein
MRFWKFGRKEEDMGEEEIRAIMEIEKLTMSGFLGLILTALVGLMVNFPKLVKENTFFDYFKIITIYSLFIAFGILWPIERKYKRLARKLDELKKSKDCGGKSS